MSAPSYEDMIEALRTASDAVNYLWNNIGDDDPLDGNIMIVAAEDKHGEACMRLLGDAREKLAAVLDKIDHVPS